MNMHENERERGNVLGNDVGKTRTWEQMEPAVLREKR